MFDLATCPQQNRPGLPFDWGLLPPCPLQSHPYYDWTADDGVPVAGSEMLAVYSLALEDSLQTAVILSLFTDARALPDDKLPPGQTDRRGWVGEEFMTPADGSTFDARADAWGSRLWLCHTGKIGGDALELARFTAQEAMAWMVRDGIASRVSVTAEWAGERLAVRVAIYQPGQIGPVYDVLWGTALKRSV